MSSWDQVGLYCLSHRQLVDVGYLLPVFGGWTIWPSAEGLEQFSAQLEPMVGAPMSINELQ
jgi:hypothetical protein